MSLDDYWTKPGEYKEMHTFEIENIKLQYLLVGVFIGIGISVLTGGLLWLAY
jgi:hypothetical protein